MSEISDDFEEIERQLELKLQGAAEDNLYEVSEFGESYAESEMAMGDGAFDDARSVLTHMSLDPEKSKNFIPEGADLDLIVEQLVNKRSNRIERLKEVQGTYFEEVKQL